MTIIPGTLVRLPNGSNGIVVPPPWWTPGRVLVKVRTGRRRWFKVDECTPIPSGAPTSCMNGLGVRL
ncbi:MAG: hypothetical protein HC866_21995 [Leptolyngbyaceae cyanobacterium RU_5_1]|nr:hypothetical protein [Leptolyngbyaceae cyanobacterium RU_5_1]